MEAIEVLDRAEISGTNVVVEYSKTEAALAGLRAKYSGVVFDLTTTKGDKDARAARLELVTLRTSLEKKRKEFKAPALAFGKKIDSEAERVTNEIVKLEVFIDQQIKADEDRRADEKAEKDRIEALRVQGIQDKISAIRAFATKCQGISSERIAIGINMVSKINTSADVFFEFQGSALAAQVETLQAMRTIHADTAAREAESERIEAQRLENERIAEQNRAQAVAMAEQQAKLDKAAEELKAEQDHMNSERTRLAAEAKARADAEIAAATAAAQAEANRASAEAIAKAQAEHPAVVAAVAQFDDDVRVMLTRPTEPARYVPHSVTAPELKLGQICTRLGFQVTADFLRSLGFEPAGRERSAILFHEADFARICIALVRHINAVRQGVTA